MINNIYKAIKGGLSTLWVSTSIMSNVKINNQLDFYKDRRSLT